MDINSTLQGSWTHSYEEDEGEVQVYRRSDSFAFPASRRGRETLSFGTGGQMSNSMPGPDDRQQHSSGTVTGLGMNRYRFDGGADPGKVIEVVSAAPDRLCLRLAG